MLGRLLGTLAKRGLLPSRLHSVLIDEIGAFQVDLQVEGVDADSGERIAASLRQIVGVEWVLTAFKNR